MITWITNLTQSVITYVAGTPTIGVALIVALIVYFILWGSTLYELAGEDRPVAFWLTLTLWFIPFWLVFKVSEM